MKTEEQVLEIQKKLENSCYAMFKNLNKEGISEIEKKFYKEAIPILKGQIDLLELILNGD